MATFNVQPVPNNNGYNIPQQISNPYGNYLFNGFPTQSFDPNFLNKQQNNSQNSLNVNQNQFLKCRPVSSKEQAIASQIDLDGSLWVFTDVGNGKIYTKQINNDGTATFKTYTLSKDEESYHSSSEFVTKDEFNRVIQSLLAAIQSPQLKQQNETQTEETKGQIPLSF